MEDLTGKQLGPYQIVAPLGEGGMAAVFKAYQPNMDRYVALKVLPRHFASDPEFIGRFSQEARVIANLQHPHILPVHDFGEADGYTYLAMRFIEGGTLADWLKENGPIALEKIRSIMTQVGGALDYAHAQGVIHRDIKPSNILVDPWGNCLLTDFGLAKMTASTANLTQTGGILGTPAYMSPEQGLGQKIDSRSDIYSLGVVLYQMAIGRLPYQAETPMAIVIKHIHDPLPPPSQFKPDIPEGVERVILKALTKNPADRFSTAGEMVKALQSATEQPTLARTAVPETIIAQPEMETAVSPPPPPTDKPTAVRRKRKWLPLASGLIGLIVIAGLGILIFGGGGDGRGEDERVAGITDLDQLSAIVDKAYANEDLELVLAAINQAIDIAPEQADWHCQLGYALNDAEDADAAIDAFTDCMDLAQEQSDFDLQSEAFGQITMLEAYRTMEETDDVNAALAVIDEATQNPVAPPWLICERAEHNLGYDDGRAVSDFEVCRQEMANDSYWRDRSEAMISMIYGYDSMASEDYYSAIDQFTIWANIERDNPWPHCALGDAHMGLHEFDPAREQYNICLELGLEQGDADAENQGQGGKFYTETQIALLDGDMNRALDNFNQAIEWLPDQPHLFCERGMVHQELGAPEAARTDYEICRELFGDDPGGRSWAEDLLRTLDEG